MSNVKFPMSNDKPLTQGGEHSLDTFDPENTVVINIKLVRGVLDYDFPQAKIAWEALEEAGISPGELVANALKEGHDYLIEEYQRINRMAHTSDPNLTGESKVSSQSLMEYKYVVSESVATNLLASAGNKNALVKIEDQLVKVEKIEVKDKSIQMTAILAHKPAQLAQNPNILPSGSVKASPYEAK